MPPVAELKSSFYHSIPFLAGIEPMIILQKAQPHGIQVAVLFFVELSGSEVFNSTLVTKDTYSLSMHLIGFISIVISTVLSYKVLDTSHSSLDDVF